VLVALEEKGARYRLCAVPPGTLKTPEHLARHPFGRVPVMEHGSFRLYESQAILRYLDLLTPRLDFFVPHRSGMYSRPGTKICARGCSE
jgi:glutathione S-transferase